MCKEHHREYVRVHYANNKSVYIAKSKRHRKENAEMVRLAKSVPCVDCGGSLPYYVMDFDHRQDKSFNVSSHAFSGRLIILAEIAKCDVVCSNCHRERTAKRSGYSVQNINVVE